MMKQDVFLVCAAIVCYWSSQPTVLVLSMKVPIDLPVVFPNDDINLYEETKNVPSSSESPVTSAPRTENTSLKIPDNLLIKLSKVQDYPGLLDFLGNNGSGIAFNVNGTVDRRKLSGGKDLSRAAGCETELQTVELEKPQDATHVYWPMCVRVHRCGGCCTSSLLSCVPVKTSNTEARVLHAHYLGRDVESEFEVMGIKTLPVEIHEKCACRCREQPEDCTPLQKYKEEECKCMCTNNEAMEKCTGVNFMWDHRQCVCKCRAIEECSTGFFYNTRTCRCEAGRSSLIGKRLLKTDNINATLAAESAEPVSDGDSSSDSDLPRTTETPSTTTTRPALSMRGRKADPRLGQRAHPKKGQQSSASRLPTAKDRNEN